MILKILVVAVVVIVVNEISVSLYNHVSSQSLHLFYCDYTLVSSGSCNCPFSWIYIQLVSRSSREQTPHCISKEGECKKWINVPKKVQQKVRKTWKTLTKSCMYQRGQKQRKMIISVSSVCWTCCCFCVCMFYRNGQINVRLNIKVNVIKLEQS